MPRASDGSLAEAANALAIKAFQAHHARDLIPMWRESFEYGVGILDPHPISEQERFLWSVLEPNTE